MMFSVGQRCVQLIIVMILFSSYRRYFGVIVPHRRAAVFTARRCELVDVMDHTLHYLNRNAMVQIYSPYSGLPRYVSPFIKLILSV